MLKMTRRHRVVVSPSFTMEENNASVPGTWNPGTNYADTRYQLPQIDNLLVSADEEWLAWMDFPQDFEFDAIWNPNTYPGD